MNVMMIIIIIVIGGISSSLIHYDSWEKCSNVKYCCPKDRPHICSDIVSHPRPESFLFLHFNSRHLRCVRLLAVICQASSSADLLVVAANTS